MRLRGTLINCIVAAAVLLAYADSAYAQTSVVAGYSSNQNTETNILGPNASTSQFPAAMPAASTAYPFAGLSDTRVAQSFRLSSGSITSVAVRTGASTGGTPVAGTGVLEIYTGTNENAYLNTLVGSATFTMSSSTTTNVTLTMPVNIVSGTYWVAIRAQTPATQNNARYQVSVSGVPSSHDGVSQQFTATTITATAVNDLNIQLTLSTSRVRVAQSFYVSLPAIISSAQIYGRRVGTLTGNTTAAIYSNNVGRPSNVLVDADAMVAIPETEISTSFAWIDFTFPDLVELQPGNYWLVLESDRTDAAGNYIAWGSDSGSGYIQGEQWIEQSGVWTFQTKDSLFQLLGSNDTGVSAYTEAITLTSGNTAAVTFQITAGDVGVMILLIFLIFIMVLIFFSQTIGIFRRARA
jgi:hypothetical protein